MVFRMKWIMRLPMRASLRRSAIPSRAALRAAGFDVLTSEGTYFITASIRNLTNEPDREFCKRMTREAGITPIPLSVFYGEGGPTDLVRFAFCKKHAVLEEAGKRLNAYFAAVAG